MPTPFGGIFPGAQPSASAADIQSVWYQKRKKDTKYQHPWDHQADAWRKYEKVGATLRDVTLSLPTGTGKTATALFILQHHLNRGESVLYLCPNHVLVKQVLAEASKLGLSACNLSGKWDDLPFQDRSAYSSAKAIGVATYWTLYNSHPKIPTPTVLLFDDVHAAGSATIGPWQLEITRDEHKDLFSILEGLLRSRIHPSQMAVLAPKPTPENQRVELLNHREWLPMIEAFQAAIEEKSNNTPLYFPWTRMRGNLARAFCFLSSDCITIRPWCPPSMDISQFRDAKRRIYVSATLDRWGHLEHIIGIKQSTPLVPIAGLPVPGRRLVLNTELLLPGKDDLDRIVILASKVARSLILCRSDSEAKRVIKKLKDKKYLGKVLVKKDIDNSVEPFTLADRAALVLAARYDGMDLGNGACGQIILWGWPRSIDVLERFATETGGTEKAADARARQRIQQGMGRGTRNPNDNVVVALVGQDLAAALSRADIRQHLPPRIRAELRLSDQLADPQHLDAYYTALQTANKDWEQAVGALIVYEEEEIKRLEPDEPIAQYHRKESGYSGLLWAHNYPPARSLAIEVAQDLNGASLHEPAALWCYLAALASDLETWESHRNPYSPEGSLLLQRAIQAGSLRPWFGRLNRVRAPPQAAIASSPTLGQVIVFLQRFPVSSDKMKTYLDEALTDLQGKDPARYHQGLRRLGESLGLRSFSPKRQGATDVIWAIGKDVLFIFEAKTAMDRDSIPLDAARQARDQPDAANKHDDVVVAPGLRSTLITRATAIDGIADHTIEYINIVRPDSIAEFAEAWFEALLSIQQEMLTHPGADPTVLAATAVQMYKALPNELAATLSVLPGEEAIQTATA